MRFAVVLAVLVGGCYSPTLMPGAPCPTGVCPEGLVCQLQTGTCQLHESTLDARPGDICYGAGFVRACFDNPLEGELSETGIILLDTTHGAADSKCTADGSVAGLDACVIGAGTIDIGGELIVAGPRPLVIVASDTINVSGVLLVSATAAPPGCTATAPLGTAGGAGGSLGGLGGLGGGFGGGSAGPALTTATALRGGCSGSRGAGGDPGDGGTGGGAVYLIAQHQLTVKGEIDASGEGGDGAGVSGGGGGGGGGAGGMIGLDAPSITILSDAQIFANGGGGGEGASTITPGADGSESTDPQTAGHGGTGGTTTGGDGGDGAAGASTSGAAGGGGVDDAGGGGGGGGAGYVGIFGTATGVTAATISPPPHTSP